MAKTTEFRVYVRGVEVFGYVRGRGDFTEDDVEVRFADNVVGKN